MDYRESLLTAYATFHGRTLGITQMMREGYIDGKRALELIEEASATLTAERDVIFDQPSKKEVA